MLLSGKMRWLMISRHLLYSLSSLKSSQHSESSSVQIITSRLTYPLSGNVGLSLGHPDVLTSLCGQFTTFGKLVICAMMIRGRHRGLPYALDRAISLPGQAEHDEE